MNESWNQAWDKAYSEYEYAKLKKAFKKLLKSYIDLAELQQPHKFTQETKKSFKVEWKQEAGILKS